ncbi:hypothetical protein GCM10009839_16360 [Catenulispora yoronensis]|uniref:Uncharacterized protein n=1 Tax=Catenulispora yoronensis TaxID=450799 RepID=A0ABP5FB40_9ACTN
MNNLKTVLRRRPSRKAGIRYDPYFADPEKVEDDYRRLRRGDG